MRSVFVHCGALSQEILGKEDWLYMIILEGKHFDRRTGEQMQQLSDSFDADDDI